MAFALRVSHVVLVVIAIAAFLINLQPPKLLGIFGQTGVYGLTAATAVPLLLGISFHRIPISLAWFGSIAALVIHFGLFFHGTELFPNSKLMFGNPGVTAAIAALITIPARPPPVGAVLRPRLFVRFVAACGRRFASRSRDRSYSPPNRDPNPTLPATPIPLNLCGLW